jgi:hypothetical protein
MICYQNGKYEVNEDETYMFTNNLNGVQTRSHTIIGIDCCEQFIRFLMQPHIYNSFKYVYAHNGAKYDNVLMLQQMLKMKSMTISPLFNSGRLLSLKL